MIFHILSNHFAFHNVKLHITRAHIIFTAAKDFLHGKYHCLAYIFVALKAKVLLSVCGLLQNVKQLRTLLFLLQNLTFSILAELIFLLDIHMMNLNGLSYIVAFDNFSKWFYLNVFCFRIHPWICLLLLIGVCFNFTLSKFFVNISFI